ncbi:YicC/YloC family endoribonuclease [Endozoicomonas sp. SESOKO1]|uniref:YicC/YloC family endoribonuclease n=1 Tax=Endozoicomonas sp. SESOKO1 TaxID=2828742 RepID=UPI0021472773|nr:YicC/YloC family endoribonuclease [Endozoicomonas sp. SESOKO1]
MTSSMTAFARVQIQEDWGSLVWEIRSVNHRYLEPHFRLTEQTREIEPALRELIRKQLKRGKLECSLKYQLIDKEQVLDLNRALLEKLQLAVREVETHFSQVAPVNPLEVLLWPGVQSTEETEMAVVHQAAIKGFNKALIQLNEMRQREGQELQSFIEARLDKMGDEVLQLRVLLPEILQNQREKILDRLSEAKQELNPERLEQEMVMLAQKMDVDEELDRLETHIAEVRRTLNNPGQGAVGRRLDFLMQELNREANTLSSKSIHAGLTQSAVNLKVFIEQMREQVQNIE